MTGCGAKATPAVAVAEGCVAIVNRLAAAGLTTTLPEVALLSPLLLKLIVMVPALVMDKLPNAATPFTAVTPVVPCSTPLPAARVALTTVLLSLERKFPNASCTWMAGCCPKATPAVALLEGWVTTTNCAAPAALILKLALTAEPAPALEAVSALLPLRLRLKLLKVARPLPSVVWAVAPLKLPLPLLKLKLTEAPETLFPKLSVARTVTAGLMLIPATASVGGCTNTSVLAAPALMLKLLLAAELNPELLAVNTLLPARLMLRLVNVANPLASVVRVVVPLRVPVPALSARLTLTPLLDTLFPSPSCNCTVTAGLSSAPAAALLGPCTNTSCAADAGLITMLLEVALVRLPLVNTIVMLLATLCDKLVNPATPLTAARLVVPCSVPEPEPRVAVTTLVSLKRTLPN